MLYISTWWNEECMLKCNSLQLRLIIDPILLLSKLR
jgi:hypothetical protein